MPIADAQARALELGREFISRNNHLLAGFRESTQFEFITCNELQQTPSYQMHHRAIDDYLKRCSEFRLSVEKFSAKYHRNEWDKLSKAQKEYRLRKSTCYFVEEFAIFACLVGRGITVMAYPGSFSTLTEIADNKFPGISAELESLCVVSLHFQETIRHYAKNGE